MEVADKLKDNFVNLVDFAKQKLSSIISSDDISNFTEIGGEIGHEMSDAATVEMNKALFRRDLIARVISVASTLVVAFFTVKFMRDQMDPTRKEKEKAREKVFYFNDNSNMGFNLGRTVLMTGWKKFGPEKIRPKWK